MTKSVVYVSKLTEARFIDERNLRKNSARTRKFERKYINLRYLI